MVHQALIVALTLLNATPSQAEPPVTDHDKHAGHTAAAIFASSIIPTGIFEFQSTTPPLSYGAVPGAGFSPNGTSIPAIGVRTWIKSDMAVDLAVGFAVTRAIYKQDGISAPTYDPASASAVYLHGGVPFAIYKAQHYGFLVTPELNVGYSWGATHVPAEAMPPQDDGNPATLDADVQFHGVLVEVGVRTGPEITLGYFDLPDVVIQPTLGLFFHFDTLNGAGQLGGYSGSETQSNIAWSTQGTNTPWWSSSFNASAGLNILYYF